MTDKKHIIWSDCDLNYDDWKEDLEEQYPELSEEERYSLMYEINGEYLNDERENLNIQLSQPIIVIGDLGLWNGRASGYRMIESGNICDCLVCDCDYNEWYVDKNGDLRCTAIHHDGTNYYLYRVFKDGVSEEQLSRLQRKIYENTATRRDITRLTRRLGDEIGKVYGWQFSQRQERMVR